MPSLLSVSPAAECAGLSQHLAEKRRETKRRADKKSDPPAPNGVLRGDSWVRVGIIPGKKSTAAALPYANGVEIFQPGVGRASVLPRVRV